MNNGSCWKMYGIVQKLCLECIYFCCIQTLYSSVKVQHLKYSQPKCFTFALFMLKADGIQITLFLNLWSFVPGVSAVMTSTHDCTSSVNNYD